ncbi:MAG: glycosyltransferase [Phycisphaerales bacterium]
MSPQPNAPTPTAAPYDPREASVPPGWPRTDRPLRIALLGWARLSFQAQQGSGYNLSASELAAGLAMSGHEVVYLSSGRRYGLRPWAFIARTERWRGVECFDLYNSPNPSPASYNFRNTRAELDHGRQVRLVLRWLERRRIDVVHIHSLEGFPLSLIGAIEAAGGGRRAVVTPHNYWFVCPQVDLMRGETALCRDYDGGRACEGCLRSGPAWRTRLKRRLGQAAERVVGMEIAGLLRKAAKEVPDRWRELTGALPPESFNARKPDPETAAGFDAGAGGGGAGARGDGLIRHHYGWERRDSIRKPIAPTALDDNEKFLASDRHLVVLNGYGRRRVAGVEALNRASLVIPPSDFVRSVYVRMGLDERRSRTVRLGQPHFDQINRRARRSPFYGMRPWDPATARRPLRFAFFGAMRPSKGIDILAAAIPLLTREVRQRCQFHIRAQGKDWPLRKALSVFPEVAFSGQYDLLQLIGSGGEYDVGLLPHAWFENSPLVLLEHLHAGKFVICSRLGGPVEWVRPPLNGLMVEGGRPEELAAAMTKLARGEVAIPSPREVHEATPILRSYPDHVAEIEGIYREVLGEREAPADARVDAALGQGAAEIAAGAVG